MSIPLEEPPAHSPFAEAARPASGRGMRKLTKLATGAHGGGRIGELIADVYNIVFAVVLAIGMAVGAVEYMNASLRSTSGVEGLDRTWLAVAITLLIVGLGIGVTARLGPLGVGGGQAAWWLPTPADRAGIVRPRLVGVLALALGLGAAAGLFVSVLATGSPTWTLAAIGALVLALIVLAVTAGQVIGRSWRRHPGVIIGDTLLALAPVVALVAVFARPPALPASGGSPAAVLALAVAVVALGVVVDRRLDRVSGIDLRARGATTAYAAGAASALDTRELGRALSATTAPDRRRRSGRFTWVRGPVSALVTGDALVLVRSPRHIIQIVVALVVPLTVAMAGWPVWLTVIAMFGAGYLAALGTAESARRAEMSPVLDRSFPLEPRQVRRTRLIVPMVVMTIWTISVVLAWASIEGHAIGWAVLALVAGPTFGAGAVRAAYRKSVDWSKPLINNPMGPPIPPGLFAGFSTGPDIVVLCLLPLWLAVGVFGPTPLLIVVQAAASLIAWAIAGKQPSEKSFTERMNEMAEEQRKATEQARRR